MTLVVNYDFKKKSPQACAVYQKSKVIFSKNIQHEEAVHKTNLPCIQTPKGGERGNRRKNRGY